MKPLLIVVLAPMILMGVAAPAAAAPYRALGTEPFWSLTIDSRITYDPATGRKINTRTPQAKRTPNGVSYSTPFIAVEIIRRRCSDGMSDRLYPDTVRIRVGLRKFNGCGGGSIGSKAR